MTNVGTITIDNNNFTFSQNNNFGEVIATSLGDRLINNDLLPGQIALGVSGGITGTNNLLWFNNQLRITNNNQSINLIECFSITNQLKLAINDSGITFFSTLGSVMLGQPGGTISGIIFNLGLSSRYDIAVNFNPQNALNVYASDRISTKIILGGYNTQPTDSTLLILQGSTDKKCLTLLQTANSVTDLINFKDSNNILKGGVTKDFEFFGTKKRIVTNKTINYNPTINDDLIIFNGTSLVCTLPSASTMIGHEFTIKNINNSLLFIQTSLNQTIDGQTSISLNQWGVLVLVSDGTNWVII